MWFFSKLAVQPGVCAVMVSHKHDVDDFFFPDAYQAESRTQVELEAVFQPLIGSRPHQPGPGWVFSMNKLVNNQPGPFSGNGRGIAQAF